MNIDIGGLTQPLTKLVEVVSKGIGTVYEPTAIVRKARAEGEAAIILAEADLKKRALMERAVTRLLHVETRRQENIEQIIDQAKIALPEAVSSDPVSQDWINSFFEDCKDVGDSHLQHLWGQLLAGEVAKPGSFSRRTLQILRGLDPYDAKCFECYCSISLHEDDSDWRFALSTQAARKVFEHALGSPMVEAHLVALGLVGSEMHLFQQHEEKAIEVCYFDRRIQIPRAKKPEPDTIAPLLPMISMRLLTVSGQELAALVSQKPNYEFFDETRKEIEQELELLTTQ